MAPRSPPSLVGLYWTVPRSEAPTVSSAGTVGRAESVNASAEPAATSRPMAWAALRTRATVPWWSAPQM